MQKFIELTFSKDVHGPIIPWILMSLEQLISNVPLKQFNASYSLTKSLIKWIHRGRERVLHNIYAAQSAYNMN